jgi:hypothetical protein
LIFGLVLLVLLTGFGTAGLIQRRCVCMYVCMYVLLCMCTFI